MVISYSSLKKVETWQALERLCESNKQGILTPNLKLDDDTFSKLNDTPLYDIVEGKLFNSAFFLEFFTKELTPKDSLGLGVDKIALDVVKNYHIEWKFTNLLKKIYLFFLKNLGFIKTYTFAIYNIVKDEGVRAKELLDTSKPNNIQAKILQAEGRLKELKGTLEKKEQQKVIDKLKRTMAFLYNEGNIEQITAIKEDQYPGIGVIIKMGETIERMRGLSQSDRKEYSELVIDTDFPSIADKKGEDKVPQKLSDKAQLYVDKFSRYHISNILDDDENRDCEWHRHTLALYNQFSNPSQVMTRVLVENALRSWATDNTGMLSQQILKIKELKTRASGQIEVLKEKSQKLNNEILELQPQLNLACAMLESRKKRRNRKQDTSPSSTQFLNQQAVTINVQSAEEISYNDAEVTVDAFVQMITDMENERDCCENKIIELDRELRDLNKKEHKISEGKAKLNKLLEKEYSKRVI
jgi:hypothetical protein